MSAPGGENNIIAAWFWKNNLWTAGYLLAVAGNYAGADILIHVDKTGV